MPDNCNVLIAGVSQSVTLIMPVPTVGDLFFARCCRGRGMTHAPPRSDVARTI